MKCVFCDVEESIDDLFISCTFVHHANPFYFQYLFPIYITICLVIKIGKKSKARISVGGSVFFSWQFRIVEMNCFE